MNDFQIHALAYAPFAGFFELSDADLQKVRASVHTVTSTPGKPCRVSLQDALPGEKALLIHYVHQPADTPFHSGHAIYVRQHAVQARPAVNEMPAMMVSRLLSLRAFDASGIMLRADVTEGSDGAPSLRAMLEDAEVDTVHLHNARHGCYLARATRA